MSIKYYGLGLLFFLILTQCNTSNAVKKPSLTENSILLNQNGLVKKQAEKKYTTWSLYTTVGNKDRGIDYSIYESKFNKYLIISSGEEKPIIELEYIGEKGEYDEQILEEIDERRQEWIKVCNDHFPDVLIEDLYSNPPIYYNHKPLITDQLMLIEEYSYMTNPNYQLDLRPLHIEQVNEDLVYEIGQCSGSYGGKYVIVWRKEVDGEWRIHLDSNI